MKSLKVFLFSFTLFFASGALANMMCVITPAHDNPFFKAEADIAEETANFTRKQILTQAGTSVLAQANALPQSALALLV